MAHSVTGSPALLAVRRALLAGAEYGASVAYSTLAAELDGVPASRWQQTADAWLRAWPASHHANAGQASEAPQGVAFFTRVYEVAARRSTLAQLQDWLYHQSLTASRGARSARGVPEPDEVGPGPRKTGAGYWHAVRCEALRYALAIVAASLSDACDVQAILDTANAAEAERTQARQARNAWRAMQGSALEYVPPAEQRDAKHARRSAGRLARRKAHREYVANAWQAQRPLKRGK